MLNTINRAAGSRLAGFLSKSLPGYRRLDTVTAQQMSAVLETGDILLVEGNTRISSAIKYLTQSSWSHAALYVGSKGDPTDTPGLLEADLQDGVRLVSLEFYEGFNLRICRPVNLTEEDRNRLVEYARNKLGHQYDLRNVLDLIRYLIQKPAVPTRYRRAMIGLGSGEPTKAICSTLIAETFQSIGYPILPVRRFVGTTVTESGAIGASSGAGNSSSELFEKGCEGEVPEFYKRHFTHFTPRDFDLSPYFDVIKPTLEQGFDHRALNFKEHVDG